MIGGTPLSHPEDRFGASAERAGRRQGLQQRLDDGSDTAGHASPRHATVRGLAAPDGKPRAWCAGRGPARQRPRSFYSPLRSDRRAKPAVQHAPHPSLPTRRAACHQFRAASCLWASGLPARWPVLLAFALSQLGRQRQPPGAAIHFFVAAGNTASFDHADQHRWRVRWCVRRLCPMPPAKVRRCRRWWSAATRLHPRPTAWNGPFTEIGNVRPSNSAPCVDGVGNQTR